MTNSLLRNIIFTVAYYDVLGYPMTSFEIWKYLINMQGAEEDPIFSLEDVFKELEKEEIKNHIDEYRGFYFLKGKKDLVEQRICGDKISNRKIKKAQKITTWLRLIPFIKMIAVAGRVGSKNAQVGSDIDMLIIFKHGKIFTGRFLATVATHFLGQRRHKNKITNRICLNHFLSDKCDISVRDLYSAHSYVFTFPLYGGKFYQNFFKENNWIKKYRPNFLFLENNAKEIFDDKFSFWIRRILEIIFRPDFFEKVLKKWQVKKIKNNPLTGKAGGVIIYNDFELAFWPDFENQGPKIFEEFKGKSLSGS